MIRDGASLLSTTSPPHNAQETPRATSPTMVASMLSETFFGLIFHKQLKGIDRFTYAEEKADFKAPEHLMPGYKTRMAAGGSASEKAAEQPSSEVQSSSSTTVDGPSTTVPTTTAPAKKDDDTLERPPADMTADDPYIVDWYGDDDPANPQNWPRWKKSTFLALLMVLTTSVYMGSSIVTPSIPYMAQYFNVGLVPTSLSLTLFVFGYGIGPMIGLCSASEIPAIGRAIPYVLTLAIFVILQVPTALVTNVAGYMILRFLAGLFGSPPLATGGASVQDVWTPMTAPLALGMWGISASAGPVLGPLIGGFATQGFYKTSLGIEAWRWTIYPLLILTGVTLILLVTLMPETSASNILKRRADRLRQATGNPHLRSRGELFAETMTGREIALMTFVRPLRLGLFEPIALAVNLHIGLVYGILYSFFESFSIVFTETYGFNLGESGLAYLGILVANLIVYCCFALWFLKYYRPRFVKSKGRLAPEVWLQPAMFGALMLPASLFMFGWTANRSIHWIVPIIGTCLFSPAIFGLFTSGLNLLALAYPDYVASVFSANDFMRAAIGGAMPLVSRQLFNNLDRGPKAFPVAWGCTLLGGVALVMVPIPYLLAYYGPALRRASKYARDPVVSEKEEGDGATSPQRSETKEDA